MSFEQSKSIEEEKAKFEKELFSQLSLYPGGAVEGKQETSLHFDYNNVTGEVERGMLEAYTKRPEGKMNVLEGCKEIDSIWKTVEGIFPEGAIAFLQEQLNQRETEWHQRIDNASKWIEHYKKEGREEEVKRCEKDLERYQRNLAGFLKEKERLTAEK